MTDCVTGCVALYIRLNVRVTVCMRPTVTAEWEHWRDQVAPKTDCANDYCKEHPLQVPFWEELFSGSLINSDKYIAPHVSKRRSTDDPAEYETTNSVLWSNRGERCKFLCMFLCACAFVYYILVHYYRCEGAACEKSRC